MMERTSDGWTYRSFRIRRHTAVRSGFCGRWTVMGCDGLKGFPLLSEAKSFIDHYLNTKRGFAP